MRCIVQGLAVEYEDRGTGKVVVMLHGWGNTLHTFDSLAGTLSGRIVRLDLPGFGESETPKTAWTLDDYVRFVKSFTGKMDIKPDILVGHSLGGRILLKGVSTGALSARKIILIASAGVAERNTARNFFLGLLAKTGRIVTSVPPFNLLQGRLRRYLYKTIGGDYAAAGALRGTFLNIVTEDLSEAAKGIAVPALIIWGGDDDTTPVREGERLNQLIAGSTFRVIGGAGHFVHKEKPDEVSAIMRQFIV